MARGHNEPEYIPYAGGKWPTRFCGERVTTEMLCNNEKVRMDIIAHRLHRHGLVNPHAQTPSLDPLPTIGGRPFLGPEMQARTGAAIRAWKPDISDDETDAEPDPLTYMCDRRTGRLVVKRMSKKTSQHVAGDRAVFWTREDEDSSEDDRPGDEVQKIRSRNTGSRTTASRTSIKVTEQKVPRNRKKVVVEPKNHDTRRRAYGHGHQATSARENEDETEAIGPQNVEKMTGPPQRLIQGSSSGTQKTSFDTEPQVLSKRSDGRSVSFSKTDTDRPSKSNKQEAPRSRHAAFRKEKRRFNYAASVTITETSSSSTAACDEMRRKRREQWSDESESDTEDEKGTEVPAAKRVRYTNVSALKTGWQSSATPGASDDMAETMQLITSPKIVSDSTSAGDLMGTVASVPVKLKIRIIPHKLQVQEQQEQG